MIKRCLSFFTAMIILQGCVAVHIKEKPRVDQSVGGNEGYVVGEPKVSDDISRAPVRETVDVDVKNPMPIIKKVNPFCLIKKADDLTKEYLW